MIGRRALLGAAALCGLGGRAAAQAGQGEPQESALARVRRKGRLVVAVYQDLPPFNVKGRGIDIELAALVAQAVGVPLSLLEFPAGETLGDDLRNAVWRGHYLGWGPADVMLHVPMDRPLIEANPQVDVFGPYYRERVMLAWDRERGPAPESADVLRGLSIAVAGPTLAGALLAGAEGGALREGLRTQHADGFVAAQALRGGKADAAAGLASELESALVGADRYQVVPLPLQRAPRNGWVVGCAVKRGSDDLARPIQDRLLAAANGGELRELFKRHGVTWRG